LLHCNHGTGNDFLKWRYEHGLVIWKLEQKAEAISQSIFWDGGSARDILNQCTKDEIDSMYDQVQAYEAAAACVLFF